MIQDLLSEDNVSFHYPAETWEDVSVALFLCAPNKDEHIQLLTDIATLFEDEEFLDAAVDFESIDDVQAFLAEHLDEQ